MTQQLSLNDSQSSPVTTSGKLCQHCFKTKNTTLTAGIRSDGRRVWLCKPCVETKLKGRKGKR